MRCGKFRKLPVVIEAVPVADILEQLTTPSRSFSDDWPTWLIEAYNARKVRAASTGVDVTRTEDTETINIGSRRCIMIETDGHGLVMGESEDWLIRGVNGELYPCNPDVFAKTYEEI